MRRETLLKICVVLFGMTLAISISGALMFAGLLLLLWGIEKAQKNKFLDHFQLPYTIPLLLFLAWTTFSTLLNRSVEMGDFLSMLTAYLLIPLLASDFLDKQKAFFLRWFVIGSVVAGAVGVLQYAWSLGSFHEYNIHRLLLRDGRAVGTRSHPLTYAESFIPAIILLIYWLTQEWRQRKTINVLLLAALSFVFAGLLFSQSRGVWLGLFVGLLVMGFSFSWKKGLYFLLGLVVLNGLLFAVSPQLRGRVASSFSSSNGSEADQQSKQTRFQLWKKSVESIQQHPLMGVGFKGAKLTVSLPWFDMERTWSECHNIYLQLLVEGGVVGFLFFGFFLGAFIRMLWTLPPEIRGALLGCLVTFLFSGLTESWLNDKEIALIFLSFVGYSTSLYIKQRGAYGPR